MSTQSKRNSTKFQPKVFLTCFYLLRFSQSSFDCLLPRLAEELGVTTDYLLSGREGIITGTIPAIKADKSLKLKAKKILIALVEELRSGEQTAPPEADCDKE